MGCSIAVIFCLTPQDLAWHVGYAFDPLALQQGLLSIVAAAIAPGRGGSALA